MAATDDFIVVPRKDNLYQRWYSLIREAVNTGQQMYLRPNPKIGEIPMIIVDDIMMPIPSEFVDIVEPTLFAPTQNLDLHLEPEDADKRIALAGLINSIEEYEKDMAKIRQKFMSILSEKKINIIKTSKKHINFDKLVNYWRQDKPEEKSQCFLIMQKRVETRKLTIREPEQRDCFERLMSNIDRIIENEIIFIHNMKHCIEHVININFIEMLFINSDDMISEIIAPTSGRFDETLKICVDPLLWLAVQKHSDKVSVCNKIVFQYDEKDDKYNVMFESSKLMVDSYGDMKEYLKHYKSLTDDIIKKSKPI
jgi:hypothetical protein